jgi:hypothetical protein
MARYPLATRAGMGKILAPVMRAATTLTLIG